MGLFINATTIQNINIGSDVKWYGNTMANAFYRCLNLRGGSIPIPDGVTDLYQAFYWCGNFNLPVTIPNTVTNMTNTFMSCRNFNQPITIPDSGTSLYQTFHNCVNFNQPITIPNSVTSLYQTFYNCFNFNSDVHVYSSANLTSTFRYCNNWGGNLFLHSPEIRNVNNFCNGKNNNHRLNVYVASKSCNTYLAIISNKGNQIFGTNLTWGANDTNGCTYNLTRNLYIYFNPDIHKWGQ